jgi:hypothetical protein
VGTLFQGRNEDRLPESFQLKALPSAGLFYWPGGMGKLHKAKATVPSKAFPAKGFPAKGFPAKSRPLEAG